MKALGYGVSFTAGATLAYFFDPDRGRRRRARMRDEADHLMHVTVRSLQKASVDGTKRVRGAAIHARQRASGAPAVDDGVLSERVRAHLGRACSRPTPLAISAHAGTVEVRGPILREDAAEVLRQIARVPGVVAVEDALERHDAGEAGALLQYGSCAQPPTRTFWRRKWPISVRWAVGIAGASLAATGFARGGGVGGGLALLGAGAVLRAARNHPLTSLFGVGGDATPIDVTKTIAIDAPVEDVFRYFVAFENFPKFARHVLEVKPLDENRWRWTVEAPGGLRFEWNAVVTEFVPSSQVAWTSTEGAILRNRGQARFEAVSDRKTRVTIRLAYEPPFGPAGHAIAKLLGADPGRELDADMLRFKSLLETGKVTGREGRITRADIDRPKA